MLPNNRSAQPSVFYLETPSDGWAPFNRYAMTPELKAFFESAGRKVVYIDGAITDRPRPAPLGGILNLEQAAAYLGYKPEGLRKIVKLKQIQYSQNGRGPIRFRKEWLDAYIASNIGGPQEIERSPAKRKVAAPVTLPPAAFGFDPSHIRG